MNKEQIMGGILELSVLDLDWLVKELSQRFGVSAAPLAVAAAPQAGAAAVPAAAPVEEKTEFTVTLKEIGPNKINVIKTVRELVPNLGLKEAKDLVEAAPKAVGEGLNKEDAEKFRQKLEGAGAKVAVE
ncbi:MAG: 50S ribosomal protein L7/L12 [Chloroflexi bacterium]|nr:50S ribosomal protein L7/L12 [Chloroflexota bacterium]